MSNVVVFQIMGQYGNGKDTFADALEAAILHRTGEAPMRLQYSVPVKEIAILLGMPREIAYGNEKTRRGWTKYLHAFKRAADGREWLQWIGTEFGRMQVSEDIWVEQLAAKARMEAARNNVRYFTITDTRFKNEIFQTSIRLPETWNFVRIRVIRPGFEVDDPHQSEAEQKSVPDSELNEVVSNDSHVEALVGKARTIAEKYCVAG